MADIVNIANVIVENNTLLRERIPQATWDNIPNFYNALKVDPAMMNAFITDLVDKVAIQSVIKQMFSNPLAQFKSGDKPLGRFVERTHTNPVKAETYDVNATTLLTVREPDVAAEYFQRNRQDKYPITVNEPLIRAAFTSWDKLGELTQEIVNGLYTGEQIDEWTLMKSLFSDALASDLLVTAENDMTDPVTGSKSLLKGLKNYARAMRHPSEQFNAYNKDATKLNKRITWTRPEDQVILIRSDLLTEIEVEYLAGVFNLSKVEPDKQIVEVSDFGMDPTIQAVICDRAFFQVYDDLTELRTFDNAETLNLTYFYHKWQTMGLSMFANHVAFVDAAAEVTP